MPDITMCDGAGCADKESCYRHTAKPTEGRQAFFLKPPGKDATCRHYWPVEETLVWTSQKKLTKDG